MAIPFIPGISVALAASRLAKGIPEPSSLVAEALEAVQRVAESSREKLDDPRVRGRLGSTLAARAQSCDLICERLEAIGTQLEAVLAEIRDVEEAAQEIWPPPKKREARAAVSRGRTE
jgi:hypothetical protein